jgi:hypothetical protein
MLASFIIQRILEEEQEERRRREDSRRPALEIPVTDEPRPSLTDDRDRTPNRGVLIIDPDEG